MIFALFFLLVLLTLLSISYIDSKPPASVKPPLQKKCLEEIVVALQYGSGYSLGRAPGRLFPGKQVYARIFIYEDVVAIQHFAIFFKRELLSSMFYLARSGASMPISLKSSVMEVKHLYIKKDILYVSFYNNNKGVLKGYADLEYLMPAPSLALKSFSTLLGKKPNYA